MGGSAPIQLFIYVLGVVQTTMIEFKNVSKKYSTGTEALKNVNLRIERGEFVFIVGASGSGKSTFLKTIMREEVPTSGTIMINNYDLTKMTEKEIPYFRRTMGIVFQDFRLIPTMTVYDNVAFAMRVIGAPDADIKQRVEYVLNLVGLRGKMDSYPNEISGGEQQRVALARALVNNANTIIADEPTGNIDPEMSYEIVDLLNHINKNGTTVIMVTHEHELVKKFNHRIVVLDHGEIVSDTAQGSELIFEETTGYKAVDILPRATAPQNQPATAPQATAPAQPATAPQVTAPAQSVTAPQATIPVQSAEQPQATVSQAQSAAQSQVGDQAQPASVSQKTAEISAGIAAKVRETMANQSPFMAQVNAYIDVAQSTVSKPADTQPTKPNTLSTEANISQQTDSTASGNLLPATPATEREKTDEEHFTTIDGVDYSKYFEYMEEEE